MNESEPKRCRICLGTDNLIIACDCVNDFERVHVKCLEVWLERSDNRFCDICGYRYHIRKKHKSRLAWLADQNHELETFVEIVAKSVQIWHCYILGSIVLTLVAVPTWRAWLPLYLVLALRLVNILYIWMLFCFRIVYNYNDWRKRNFSIEVMPNPDRNR